MEPQHGSDLDPPDEIRPRLGRPRSASADQAIIEAAAGMLAEVGYRAMSMEAVAARAGVSKATLYRRCKDKEALVIATILATSGPPPRVLPEPFSSARESMTIMLKTARHRDRQPLLAPDSGCDVLRRPP